MPRRVDEAVSAPAAPKRLSLFARLTLAFAASAVFSLGLALLIVDRSISTDLEAATRRALLDAKAAADLLASRDLEACRGKYASFAREPRFRAFAEAATDEPTARQFIQDSLAEFPAAARFVLLDRNDVPIAATGDAALDDMVYGPAAAEIGAHGSKAYLVARVRPSELPDDPIVSSGPIGRLVAVERIDETTRAAWSTFCRAEIVFVPPAQGPPDRDDAVEEVVRRLPGLDMRVQLSTRDEHRALQRLRTQLTASALLTLIASIAASLFLSRGVAGAVTGMKAAADRIGRGDFSARTGVARDDEIGDVAQAVDQMAGRLVESRSRLEALLDSLPYGVVLIAAEPAPTVDYVNDAFQRITGFSRAEAIGRPPDAFLQHKDALGQDALAALGRSEAWTGRGPAKRRDGSAYEHEVTIAPVSGGAPASYVGVIRDVTKEVGLELQLRQAQKMEAVGRLAGGVAHDFNNLLTAIQGYADLAMSTLGPQSAVYADLEEIKQASLRAASLTRQLLAFSRKQVVLPKVIDLNNVIASMGKLLTRLLGEDVELVTVLARGLDPIRADGGQLEQVVMNLAVNARDAMPGGGRITVETANVVVDEAAAARQVDLRAGPHVQLSVRDTGHGMDEATMGHLFEPFFTTKEAGRGTGLGLSTVYGIVKQSGGSIAVESEVGKGTTFRILWPRVDEPVSGPSREVATARRGAETVLLVEDEDVVRKLASRSLRAAGYTVLEAARGADAIRLAAGHAGRIDLLLTDVVMPGMNGPELARGLATARPDLKVLFMSGYTETGPGQEGLDPGAAFLQKPFAPERLAGKVREVLDSSPAASA